MADGVGTGEAGAVDAHALPVEVSTLPAVLGATATTLTPATVALVVIVPVGVVMPVVPSIITLMSRSLRARCGSEEVISRRANSDGNLVRHCIGGGGRNCR